MNAKRMFAVALVIMNLALWANQLAQGKPDHSVNKDVAPILRARAFEIVDEQGRIRAELKVLPAEPNFKMPDGTTGYPEAVQLRLITSQGAPNVKLGATGDGAGLVIGGPSGYVQVLSRGTNLPFVKVVTKDGKEQVLKP
jgi:hypothetical protein